jgi:hypothetical protein
VKAESAIAPLLLTETADPPAEFPGPIYFKKYRKGRNFISIYVYDKTSGIIILL